jgi:hypothetical protein
MPKRPRHSHSQPDSGAASPSTVSSAARPSKRTRLDSPAAIVSEPAKQNQKTTPTKADDIPYVLKPKKRKQIAGRLNRLAVPKPISLAAKRTGSGSTKPDINRRGNKINKGWGTGGFDAGVPLNGDEDLGEAVVDPTTTFPESDPKGKGKGKESTASASKTSSAKNVAELWITRKTSYPSYLKAGIAAFIDKGWVSLIFGTFASLTLHSDTIHWSCEPSELQYPSV